MKIKLHYFLAILPILFLSNTTSAQTTLAPGDIMIFEAQGDNPDSFSFVTFVDIDAGTGIFFTDCGADAAGFNSPCTEGARKYTAPTGGLTAGDIVRFTGSEADFATYSDAGITGNFLFSTGGDQVIAFQDATSAAGGTSASANPTFLFVISYASTVFAGNKTDSNETGLPAGLSDTASPATAIALGSGPGADNEWDNVIYNGSYDFSSEPDVPSAIAAAKLAFSSLSNYHQTNTLDTAYTTAVGNIPAALTLSGTLSTEDVTLNNALVLYPNPSKGGAFTIKNSGVALQSALVSDINGRIITTINLNGVSGDKNINLNLTTGMYFVKIQSETAATTKKLIVQ